MGRFDSCRLTVKAGAADGTYRFRVTFYGRDTAGMHWYAAHVTKDDLLGMRRAINQALKQDKEARQ